MRDAGFRYGAVLTLTVAITTFALVAPDGIGARLIEFAVASAVLVAATRTSGAQPDVRHAAVGVAVTAAVLAAVAGVAGAPQGMLVLAATSVVFVATIAVILGGLVRLVRARGVTVQSVLGALAVYLLVGLAFGFLIGALATGTSGDYFAQGTDGVQSQRVYFSFTSLTTTGFGDLTPATTAGRAVTVLEMLLGQLYLVTVISILVGNLGRRRQ
jgi:hypothetical protein